MYRLLIICTIIATACAAEEGTAPPVSATAPAAAAPVSATAAGATPPVSATAAAASETLHPFFTEAAKVLVGSNGKRIKQDQLLKNKYILVYTSANWCPSCRKFTPELVKYYNDNGGGTDFEVLFVSSDEDPAKMQAYMKAAAMPWAGLAFGSSKTGQIKKKYGGDGIPCLTVVNEKDEVVFHSYVDGKYVGPNRVLTQFTELMKKQKQQ